jgi:hypothetical protein
MTSMKNNSQANTSFSTEKNPGNSQGQNVKFNLQEFRHGSLLHGRAVETEDQHANYPKGKLTVKDRRAKVKVNSRAMTTAADLLEIFDEEKELKARFKARHI